MADRILAAVAIQRPVVIGSNRQSALTRLVARYATAALYTRPGETIDRLGHQIARELTKKWFPQAADLGARSAKPILQALGGKNLVEKGSRPRGRILHEFRRHHRFNVRWLASRLKAEGAALSGEVEAAFLAAERDGVARKELIGRLLDSDRAELRQLGKANARIAKAQDGLQKAERGAAKASKRKRVRANRQVRQARDELRKAKASRRATRSFLARLDVGIQAAARDAIRREAQAAQTAAFRQAGYSTFTWIAVNGSDACPSCESRHGQTKSVTAWRGNGPGDGTTYCGTACMCQLVPAEYTRGNPSIAKPIAAAPSSGA